MFVITMSTVQESKTLGMAENEFKYRLKQRDMQYEKLAAKVRRGMS